MCSNMGAGGSASDTAGTQSNAVSTSVNYSDLSKGEKLNYDVVSQQLYHGRKISGKSYWLKKWRAYIVERLRPLKGKNNSLNKPNHTAWTLIVTQMP